MSAKVDVLGVLDAEILAFMNTQAMVSVSAPEREAAYADHLAKLTDTRRAVAELFERVESYRRLTEEMLSAYKPGEPVPGTMLEHRRREREYMFAALDRCGGAK